MLYWGAYYLCHPCLYCKWWVIKTVFDHISGRTLIPVLFYDLTYFFLFPTFHDHSGGVTTHHTGTKLITHSTVTV